MANPNVYQGPGSGGTHHALVNVAAEGVDNTGGSDAGAQFNAVAPLLAASGQTPWFPAGSYKLTTAVLYVLGLNPVLSPDAVFTGANAASINAGPKIMFLGDSNTFGNDGLYQGVVGMYPTTTMQYMRTFRSDFDVIGSLIANPDNAAGASLPYNDGHAGFTIANLAAGYASYVASPGVGVPSIVVVMAGTNDVQGGRTLAQMQADTATLYAAIRAAGPTTTILQLPPPAFVAGTTVGANLATWNALVASYTTWLQATWIPSQKNAFYCNASTLTGNGDYQVNGVHLNQGGASVIGLAVAKQLMAMMGPPRQTHLERAFNTRQPWYSVQVPTYTDGFSISAHAGFNPGAGSFTLALDFCPSFEDVGSGSIVQYGTSGTNNYFALTVSGLSNALNLYWMTAGATIGSGSTSSFGQSPGLVMGAWHRIVIMADASTGTVGLYVNGQLAGLAQGLAAWTSVQENIFFGYDAGAGSLAAPGYYGRVYAAQAVPGRPGSMAALLAVEDDYYLGKSLCPDQGSASFTLDNILTDDVYAPGDPNPSAVLVGIAAFVPGFPGGTPVRPWEYQPPIPPLGMPGNAFTIAAPTTGNVALTAAQQTNQIIPIAMSLTGNLTVTFTRPGVYFVDLSALVRGGNTIKFVYGGATSAASTGTGVVTVLVGAQGLNTIAIST